jgi:hypothetical protein
VKWVTVKFWRTSTLGWILDVAVYLLCGYIIVMFSLLCYVFFVSLSILIVMYVPFCVFCLIVLLCVLFVCEFVLDNCHRDIGALFGYPNWGFFRAFSSVVRQQMPGYNSQRRGTARTSQFTTQCFFFLIGMCVPSAVFCVLFVCKCVLLPPGVNPIAVK